MKANISNSYIEVNWNWFQLTFFVFKKWQKRCWGCGSLHLIRWGKRNWYQRFKCYNCGLLFNRDNKGVKQSNEFIWFTKWVLGRRTFNDLVTESGYSKSTLQRLFKVFICRSLPVLYSIQNRASFYYWWDLFWPHYAWYYIMTALTDMRFTSVMKIRYLN